MNINLTVFHQDHNRPSLAEKGVALSRSDSKSNLGQNKAVPAKDQH